MRPLACILALLLVALPTAAAAASVQVMGGFYDPASVTILAGESVTWTNGDSMPHTVTSTWDNGTTFDKVLRAGESFTSTFSAPGTWGVHCRPHQGMEMSVIVQSLDAQAGIHGGLARVPAAGIALVMGAIVVGSLLLSARRTRSR